MNYKEFNVEILNKYKIDQTLMNNENYIYIGRGSTWGNPYSPLEKSKAEFKVDTREEAIKKYEDYFKQKFKDNKWFQEEFAKLKQLLKKHKTIYLVCFCDPKPCHGKYIKKILEAMTNR